MKKSQRIRVSRNIWVNVEHRPRHPQKHRHTPAIPSPAPLQLTQHRPPSVPVSNSYHWLVKPATYLIAGYLACQLLTALLPFLIIGSAGLLWLRLSGSYRR